MSDDPSPPGFLPPRAPGSQPPPQWSPGAPPPGTAASGWEPPAGAEPAAWSAPPGQRPPAAEIGQRSPAGPVSWPPPPGPAVAGDRGNGRAVAALVLGLAGMLCLVVFAGALFFVNLPCSILAWVFGVQGLRSVDRGVTAEHRGLASAGRVLGIVGVVLGALAFIGWLLAFVLSGHVGSDSTAALLAVAG